MPPTVHVIGASGRSGAALMRALGAAAIPVVRDPTRITGTPRVADLADGAALRAALADATHVVSTAHARWAPAVLAQAPAGVQRFVFLGSTRKFTRWPDAHGNGVIAGERAIFASGRPAIMLHPTMIYGAAGENNVRRLAALLRRLPVVPLPGGGRALVQPVHQDDVTRAVLAALALPPGPPEAIVLPGPSPLPYADFVRAVARAAGLRAPRIVAVPAAPLRIAASALRWLPGWPGVGPDEIRRLGEDKAFDPGPLRARLAVEPIGLEAGLATVFALEAVP